MENLKGEIQIFDSKSFNTVAQKNILTFDTTFHKKATLLIYASVDQWKSICIPEHVTTYKQLESYLEEAAKEHQIDMDAPFPFLLEGTVKSFDWHVVDWKDGDTEHSHQKHIISGPHGTVENTQVEMLGFYSNSHHAIFTHHSTNMHIHAKTTDNKVAGHVDNLILGKETILRLPKK